MPDVEATSNAEILLDSPELLTTEEVASLLRVDSITVIRWTTEQRLASIKIGPRLHRFPKALLEKYLRDAAFGTSTS